MSVPLTRHRVMQVNESQQARGEKRNTETRIVMGQERTTLAHDILYINIPLGDQVQTNKCAMLLDKHW